MFILIVMYVLFGIFCFHYVVQCAVCVYMCTVLLPPGHNPTAVNRYIIYHIICRRVESISSSHV